MRDTDLFIQIGHVAYKLGIAIDSEMRLEMGEGEGECKMTLVSLELCDYKLAATCFGNGFNILLRCKRILELQRGKR